MAHRSRKNGSPALPWRENAAIEPRAGRFRRPMASLPRRRASQRTRVSQVPILIGTVARAGCKLGDFRNMTVFSIDEHKLVGGKQHLRE